VTKKLIVGLTGGIGSGKSAAANEFAKLGATIVDTDAIAHQLTAANGRAISEIRKQFGDDAIDRHGAMDRPRMRELVFGDAEARGRLEKVLHPMIRKESDRRIVAASGPYVVYVVPLLVERRDYAERVDRVLLVDAPEQIQIERVRARGLSIDAVAAIMRSQASRAERLAAADDVIDNSGTFDALRQQVSALHQNYLQFIRP
jgi:dephospho-CoA kinase